MGLTTENLFRLLTFFKENGEIRTKALCMMGKQSILARWENFDELLYRFHIDYDKEHYDKVKGIYPIDSCSFFKMIGFKTVHSADYSDYDGADYLFDLGTDNEVVKELTGKYDYVLDGGTMEHVFNIAKAVENMAKLVKKGGYIIHLNPMAGYVEHGFYCLQPSFYEEFYRANGFEIIRLEAECIYDRGKPEEWESFFSVDCRFFNRWEDINKYIKMLSESNNIGRVLIHCIAKKVEEKEICNFPIQRIWQEIYQQHEKEGKR